MKRGQIVIGIGVGLIVSTGIYLLIKKYVLSGFKTSVLSNAKKEWKLWGSTLVVGGKEKQSGEEECSDIYRDRVGEKSGAGKDFPYSSAHTNYIRPFIQNRKQNLKSDFKAYKLHEKKAELGDLVCYPRQSGVDYDTTYSYKSHCDIVVGVNRIKRNIEVIGGNVGDGVTKKVLNTDNKGYLNDTSYEWFTIIKNNK